MDLTLILELVGLALTLMVLLYLIVGDNALFRIVTYAFIGVSAGYVLILVIFQVLLPRLLALLNSGNLTLMGLGLIPFILGILLLFKLNPRLSAVGTLPMAILVGIGAAIAVGGAVFGTLAGQIGGTFGYFSRSQAGGSLSRMLEGVFVLVGAVCTLAYFQFSTRGRVAVPSPETTAHRGAGIEALAKVGQIFIGITLGAMFAGVYTAAITALIERIGFVIGVILKLL